MTGLFLVLEHTNRVSVECMQFGGLRHLCRDTPEGVDDKVKECCEQDASKVREDVVQKVLWRASNVVLDVLRGVKVQAIANASQD